MAVRVKVLLACSAAPVSFLFSGPAHAQPAEEGAAPAQDIVVTGSRISRRDYQAESPIVTVTPEALTISGKPTLGETLNQLPQLTPASTETTGTRNNAGQTNPDLRGLGSRRTLVLLDGKRLQPSDPFNAVDLNTVPSGLISGIEIITGGASAVYGSDALAGVINIKTKRNFSGLELDAQAGVTSRKDGGNVSITGTGGVNFAQDRGNAVVSLSYTDRDAIIQPSKRPWFRDPGPNTFPTGTNTLAGVPQAAITALFNSYGITDPARIPSPAARVGANPNGTVFVISDVTRPGSAGVNYQPVLGLSTDVENGQLTIINDRNAILATPLERFSAFGRTTYELTDNVEAYVQGNYTHYTTSVGLGQGAAIVSAPAVPVTNPFFQQTDLATLYRQRPAPFTNSAVSLSAFLTPYPDYSGIENSLYQAQVGLSGKIPSLNWTWDVYYAQGSTKQTVTDRNKIKRAEFISLINSPNGGTSLCEGGFRPLPIIDLSQSCADFLLTDVTSRTKLTQKVGEANLQGGLFELPGGEVRFAAGVAYRRNGYRSTPDPRLLPIDVAGNASVFGYGVLNAAPTAGFTEVKEVYGELLVPILSDTPFFHRLELDGAFRYSDYRGIGGIETYKLTGTWEPTPGILFRGGYQRAIRAPSVGELFEAPSTGVGFIGTATSGGGDPCFVRSMARTGPNAAQVLNLCQTLYAAANPTFARALTDTLIQNLGVDAANTIVRTGGNPNLTEETASSITLGTVLQPKFDSPAFSNMSLSVDYYDIKIDDAIGILTAREIFDTCYNLNGQNPTYSPTNSACALVTRFPASAAGIAGVPAGTTTPTINLAKYQVSGIDVQFDWRLPFDALSLRSEGGLTFNVLASWTQNYKLQSSAVAPFLEYAGTIGNNSIGGLSHPKWKVTATTTVDIGKTSLGLRTRYIGPMSNSANVGTTNQAPGTDEVFYFDLFGRLRVTEDFTLRAGVSNLFDKAPPVWTGDGNYDRATFDVIGRSFFVGFNARF